MPRYAVTSAVDLAGSRLAEIFILATVARSLPFTLAAYSGGGLIARYNGLHVTTENADEQLRLALVATGQEQIP